MDAVVIQSYRTERVPAWIERCHASVRDWAALKGWRYVFYGDELFDMTPQWYRARVAGRMPILADLGRLMAARNLLRDGADRVAWVDADVLVFDADRMALEIESGYAFAREIWVQPDARKGRLKAFRNVHNAVCVFDRGNAMLDFYIHACERVIARVEGGVPNQIVGPKLLTTLHNLIGFELIEDVGMVSPLVARDIVAGGGPALDRLNVETGRPLVATNLCASLVGRKTDGVFVDESLMKRVIDRVLAAPRSVFGEPDLGG